MILFYILLSICIIGWVSVAIISLCSKDDDDIETPEFKRIYTNRYGYVYIQTNKKKGEK